MEFILVESYAAVVYHDRQDLAILRLDFEYCQWLNGGDGAMVQPTSVNCVHSRRD